MHHATIFRSFALYLDTPFPYPDTQSEAGMTKKHRVGDEETIADGSW